ncbi:telomerase-binding protein est1a [Diaporthe amygdali]|uniref:telomerase-binding protein est1a n=1 Tax=Phomopsis amygdali TaxID=1214568 RepID=UPI0022FEF8D6|nr:telomerase-binding protein est1a [Diaporthe amygdali]KAJ0103746.1 telomerase-binding protein est1a [Diaporthe amygdali]
MLTFIYLAYSMMTLLYETVPNFEDTWIECLGDLGRYRMAIEDEDIRDREIWTDVSRYWYSKASDKAPTTGRLHHHLAILARPDAVKQLFYYTKSLCVAIPFKSARDSILTLFNPIINGTQTRLQAIDLSFVKAHGILFITSNTGEKDKAFPNNRDELMVEYERAKNEFLSHLDNHIARTTRSWMEPGALIAISNCNSLLEYGKTEANTNGDPSVLMTAILPKSDSDTFMGDSTDDKLVPSKVFREASDLAKQCDAIISRRYGDPNVLPYLNVRLSFMRFICGNETAIRHLKDRFPWKLVALMLNSLSIQCQNHERVESEAFPRSDDRPLPEDWHLRGLLWADKLFPPDWFNNDKIDDDERTFELPSTTENRKERVLWLGYQLAVPGKWLRYDKQSKQFTVTPEFQKSIQSVRVLV